MNTKTNSVIEIIRFGAIILTAIVLIFGTFEILRGMDNKELRVVDNSSLVSFDVAKDVLVFFDKPGIVAEMEKPDKTLYDATAFLSTDGFSKVKVLVKNEYFDYELLTSSDYDALDILTEPTNISVQTYSDSTRSEERTGFSCFIYRIEDDYIYLGTAGHCIASESYRRNSTITFYDRTTIDISLLDYKKGGNFDSHAGDYAMYRIPTDAVPYELLINLREVTFSTDAINDVKIGDVLYSGNIYNKYKDKDYDKKITVIPIETGKVGDFLRANDSLLSGMYFTTDYGLVPGQSGSGVFDAYGNLVAICSGHVAGNNGFGIFTKASKLDELYQEFFEEE